MTELDSWKLTDQIVDFLKSVYNAQNIIVPMSVEKRIGQIIQEFVPTSRPSTPGL